MQSTIGATKSTEPPRQVGCGPVGEFDSADVGSVRRAFSSAPSWRFRQAWLSEEESAFLPGEARLGWRGNSILIFAELFDADIFNEATALNQRAWELGDVFEIFLRPASSAGYVEFQITPDNHRLQLRYPDSDAVRVARATKNLDSALVWEQSIQSRIWKSSDRWHVLAEIPATSAHADFTSLAGTEWQISFGRYDYTRGHSKPVISSTSLHAAPDFHRTQEWQKILFTTPSSELNNE